MSLPVKGADGPLVNGLPIAAKSAILMDVRTGMVLWQHNPDWELPMASTTKIMTAIVILDHAGENQERFSETTAISFNAASVGGSSAFRQGDVVSIGDLFRAALIRSSNEATVAAAEHLAGSEAAFVQWMNEKAAEIGCKHTHFLNPHGFSKGPRAPQHYSTARDLALIGRYALQHYPLIRATAREGLDRKHPDYARASITGIVPLENHNRLINTPLPGYPDAIVDGLKTGFTSLAGKCLVSSATSRGWQLVAVVLNSPDHFAECRTLLTYGFVKYRWQSYAGPTQPGLAVPVRWGAGGRLPLGAQQELGAPVPRTGAAPVDRLVFSSSRLKAPIAKGAVVGTLELRRNGKIIASAPAIALREVPVAWWARALRALWVTGLLLFSLYLLGKIYGTFTKNARRKRRLLTAARRNAHPRRARNNQW